MRIHIGNNFIKSIEPVDKKHWLELRKSGIGASESIALFGEHPYIAPYTLYCIKRGIVEPDNIDNERMCLGRHFEGGIIGAYCEMYNESIIHNFKQILLVSADNPFAMCTPDGFIQKNGHITNLVEVKSSVDNDSWKDDAGNISIPLHVQVQLQHQMYVSQTDSILLLLELFHKLYPIWVDRNNQFVDKLKIKINKFTECVEKGIDPEVDANDSNILNKLLIDKKVDKVLLDEKFIPADKMMLHFDRKIKKLNKTVRALTKKRDAIRNRIKKEIGGEGVGILPNDVKYTVRVTKRGGKYQKKTKYLSLTRKG